MAKNFVLRIIERKIEFNIKLVKATDPKTSLSRGTPDGRPVYQLTVTGKDDCRPLNLESVDRVVQNSDLVTHFVTKDESGDTVRIPIDKNRVKSLFPNSSEIKVESMIPLNSVKPRMYDGFHYHVQLRTPRKNEPADRHGRPFYTITFEYLEKYEMALLVSYVNFNRPKFAVIYSDSSEGLMLSNLIHSNYQRELPKPRLDSIKNYLERGVKIFSRFETDEIEYESLHDNYELKIKEHIDNAWLAFQDGSDLSHTIPDKSEKSSELDVLDLIDSLDEPSPAPATSKSKSKSKSPSPSPMARKKSPSQRGRKKSPRRRRSPSPSPSPSPKPLVRKRFRHLRE